MKDRILNIQLWKILKRYDCLIVPEIYNGLHINQKSTKFMKTAEHLLIFFGNIPYSISGIGTTLSFLSFIFFLAHTFPKMKSSFALKAFLFGNSFIFKENHISIKKGKVNFLKSNNVEK